MRPQIRLWSLEENKLTELTKTSFADTHKEKELESWVEQNPSLLGRNLTIIGRQVHIPKVGFVDLLSIDENGRVVIVEFKRQQSTRDTIAQILDYASSIRLLTIEQIRGLANVDETKVGDITETDPAMILVAAEADESVERIVEYLAAKAEFPIEVVTFTFATMTSGKEIIARSILSPESIPNSTAAKNATKITLNELFSIAEERDVLEIVRTLHQIVMLGWSVEVFRINGGQIRYWVEMTSGSWRVLFGMYIGSEKFSSPKGHLDIWIRPEIVAEFTGIPCDQVQNELRQFPVHHETQTVTILRVADTQIASKLYRLLQYWNSVNASIDEKTQESEIFPRADHSTTGNDSE